MYSIRGTEQPIIKWDTVDPGALGKDKKNEKDYAVEISALLGAELENTYGYTIVYTREADVTVKQKHLKWRVDLAHEKNVNYFISIHLDSFTSSKNRFAVYYWFKGKSFSKEGKNFAQSVVDAVTPRGFNTSVVKTANHYVTRNTKVPAILVECGNINYSDNDEEIKDEKFIQEFSQGIDDYVQGAQ